MEEEKKELKQESVTEKEKKIHKKIKKFLLIIPVLIVLGTSLFFVLRETGVINKYVYEEVDNLAEREGVCFDNLLFAYIIIVDRGSQSEERWLCIMNTGDVYAFEWNDDELFRWDWYYDGTEKMNDNEMHPKGYDDANWGKMENVVYLGRFSDSVVRRLNSYVDDYDINGEYYYLNPPQITVPQGGGGQENREHMEEEDEEVEWSAYGTWLFRHGYQSEIEWCRRMHPTWWGGYKKEIWTKSLDENAIAAIKLFESSGFYDRWVKMCLDGD